MAEGDSITAGNHTGNVSYVSLINSGSYGGLVKSWRNNAVGGSTVATLNARAAALDASKPVPPLQPILTVMIGINDWAAGITVPNFLTSLAAYLDARRSAGWQVVLLTILPDTEPDIGGVNANVWRNTANTTLVTWVGLHADALADVGADPIMGPDSAPNNPIYYLTDLVHPTITGQNVLVSRVAAAIASLAR